MNITTSPTVIEITKALVEAQKKIKHATKDGTNPHLKNDYATLESVIDATKEPLLEQGITVLQFVNKTSVTTRLQHVSGEFFETTLELFVVKQDMQGLGSAITYARRYPLAAILNISQKDDDGNLSSKNKATVSKTVEKKPLSTKDTDPF